MFPKPDDGVLMQMADEQIDWIIDKLDTSRETGRLALLSILMHMRDLAAAPPLEIDVQLLAWAMSNCHMLARRALAQSTSVYDREKWGHVLRICEKAGARSAGVLRAATPTEITGG